MSKVLLILVVFVCSTASAQKSVMTTAIKTAIYCDHCKQCASCGGKLQKMLLKEKGVQMVVLDEKAMTITVTYNTKKTDLPKVRQAISNLGYDADDVKASPESYARLDDCCKKG